MFRTSFFSAYGWKSSLLFTISVAIRSSHHSFVLKLEQILFAREADVADDCQNTCDHVGIRETYAEGKSALPSENRSRH